MVPRPPREATPPPDGGAAEQRDAAGRRIRIGPAANDNLTLPQHWTRRPIAAGAILIVVLAALLAIWLTR